MGKKLIKFVCFKSSYENKFHNMSKSLPFLFCKSSSEKTKGWRPLHQYIDTV